MTHCRDRRGVRSHHVAGRQFHDCQSAATFSFFSCAGLDLTLAGFAAKTRSTFVKGSMPVRFFLAGTLITFDLEQTRQDEGAEALLVHRRKHRQRERFIAP